MNIIITGGASGLGKSITEKLLSDPGHSFLVTYKTESETVKSWRGQHRNVKLVQCDFSIPESVDTLLDAISEFDPDILINNAHGGHEGQHFHKTDPSVLFASFSTNVLATLRITQKAITLFRKKKSGRIINILTSFLSGSPPTGWSVYTAEKAYLLSMSKSWAAENASFKITSNSISPEFMLTGLTADTDERIVEEMRASHPLKKLLETEEVADVVKFFVHCPSHVNGINFLINSGSNII